MDGPCGANPTVVTDADERAVNTLFGTTRAVVTAAANGIVARLPVSFE